MFYKSFRVTLCIVFAGLLSIASAAVMDTIKGVVTDSSAGTGIDSVVVASEGSTALTNSTGAFTLALATTRVVKFAPPPSMPSLTWHPENGSFSWSGHSGEVSIAVYSLQGNIVARAVFGKGASGSAFSIARLPPGMYLVAIRTQGRLFAYKINCFSLERMRLFSFVSQKFISGSASAGTSKDHIVTFTKTGYTMKSITVPAGTQDNLTVKLKSLSGLIRVFDGKSFAGWAQHPSNSWTINAADSSMQIAGGRCHVYTLKAYRHYRVMFQVRTTTDAIHHPCTLFLGQDTSADACGAVQFQLPYWGGWEYRAGHGGALGGTHWDNPPFDITKWVECEAIVNMSAGFVLAGSAYPPGAKGKKVQLLTDNSIKDYKPAPFAFQGHGDPAGLKDEYKDIFIEENPASDSLLIEQR